MEIKLTSVKVDLLKDFLGKLVNFDKNVFIKISPEITTSNVYFPNKDAVKIVEESTDSLFSFSQPLTEDIKVAFYNAKDIMTALNFFSGSDNVEGRIECVEDKSSHGLTAESFLLKNKDEKFKLFCLDPNFSFIDMTDDEIVSTFATDDLNTEADSDQVYFANFEVNFDMIKKIESRLKLKKDEAKFTIKIIDKKAYIVTKNNELLVSEDVTVVSDKLDSVTLFKKYLSLLDRENYTIHLCSSKVIFASDVSDTKLAISSSLVDEDLDTMEDLNTVEEAFDDLDDLQLN